jgi:hypothetical protein
MNRMLGLILCTILLPLGCTKQESTPVSPSSPSSVGNSSPVTGGDVAGKAQETLDLAGDLASQTKDEFVADAQRRLAQMDQKLQEWEAKSASLTADAKAKWEVEHEKLRQRRAEMQQELDKLRNATGNAWLDVKDGTTAAWKNLTDAFGKAATHFQ